MESRQVTRGYRAMFENLHDYSLRFEENWNPCGEPGLKVERFEFEGDDEDWAERC